MGKILRISLRLIFTPNTLGCYGLKEGREQPIGVIKELQDSKIFKLKIFKLKIFLGFSGRYKNSLLLRLYLCSYFLGREYLEILFSGLI